MTGENLPVPDPTALTTDQLLREVGALRELLSTRMDGTDSAVSIRFDAVYQELGCLAKSVDRRFAAVDTKMEERKVTSDRAITAALASAKEIVGLQGAAAAAAVEKAERATQKQLDQIREVIVASEKSADDRTRELKERIDRDEGSMTGSRLTRAEGLSQGQLIIATVGIFLVLVSVGISVVALIIR